MPLVKDCQVDFNGEAGVWGASGVDLASEAVVSVVVDSAADMVEAMGVTAV